MSSAQTELAGPGYALLWSALRKHVERNGLEVTGSATISSFGPVERRAVQALLGVASSRVDVAAVDRAIHNAVGCGLIEWLERLGPPLRNRLRERTEKALRRSSAEAMAAGHRIAERPWFDEWLNAVNRDGAMAAAARLEERRYLEAALNVLCAVLDATHDNVPFATVIAGATGDTKRMSSATVRALVEQALALETGTERPTNSRQRRILWGRFGVVVDDVSSDVLVLNLRPTGDTLLERWLRDAADAGEPFRVTLRQLNAMSLTWESGLRPIVSVCENPAVVMEAANRLGALSAPLVCTEGVPSDAVWSVVEGIAQSGSAIRVHADFDAAGCSIAGAVILRCDAVPWRFDAESYQTGLETWGVHLALPLSKGIVPETRWDPRLGELLRSDGRAVYEELVVDDLIADLATDLIADLGKPHGLNF